MPTKLAAAAAMSILLTTSEPAPPSSGSSSVQAAWGQLKGLAGTWNGRSTKGWTERLRYEVIAGGSVVLETSEDAHPGEKMATAFYLDGERLMLTHYCVARNQPRLEATSFSNDGKTVVFTFVDATNLRSRDQGHMDKAVLTFESPDRVVSRWSWYQDGRETWFEDIVQTRAR